MEKDKHTDSKTSERARVKVRDQAKIVKQLKRAGEVLGKGLLESNSYKREKTNKQLTEDFESSSGRPTTIQCLNGHSEQCQSVGN